jgi:hypothetical protein
VPLRHKLVLVPLQGVASEALIAEHRPDQGPDPQLDVLRGDLAQEIVRRRRQRLVGAPRLHPRDDLIVHHAP